MFLSSRVGQHGFRRRLSKMRRTFSDERLALVSDEHINVPSPRGDISPKSRAVFDLVVSGLLGVSLCGCGRPPIAMVPTVLRRSRAIVCTQWAPKDNFI